MPKSTINSTIGVTLVIGGAAHPIPFTIGTSGGVVPGYGAPEAILLEPSATLFNAGFVSARTEEMVPLSGTGVYLAGTGLLNNSGLVQAGSGVSAAPLTYHGTPGVGNYNGGYGVILDAGGSVVNSGQIIGGAGGDGGQGYTGNATAETFVYAGGKGGTGAEGGAGVLLEFGGSVTNTGVIFGGAGGGGGTGGAANAVNGGYGQAGQGGNGGNGQYGVWLGEAGSLTKGSLTNAGSIIGGQGGSGGAGGEFLYFIGGQGGAGGSGGAGVAMHAGESAHNTGLILGGAGGVGYLEGGLGGFGVDLQAGAQMVNTGTILGGDGGGVSVQVTQAGIGGAGGYVAGGVLRNGGTISGGSGGASGDEGGVGGSGVRLSGGTVMNTGTILGGAGGSYAYRAGYSARGGNGGAGVFVYSGVLYNTGTITGGQGGFGLSQDGTDGNAVYFSQYGGGGTLEVGNGAVFVGNLVGNGVGELELTGTSASALAGFGTQITGFDQIKFASRAKWTIAGDFAGLGSGETIAGFGAGDAIVLDGVRATSLKVTDKSIDLFGNRVDFALDVTGQTAAAVLLDYQGNTSTISQAAAGAVIDSHEFELVSKGATETGNSIAGGTLELLSGAKEVGPIGFAGTSGGTLILGGTVLPSAIITGFEAGDVIKLENIAYVAGASVVAGNGMVTIDDGGRHFSLNIAGVVTGETGFTFGPGSVLTTTLAAG